MRHGMRSWLLRMLATISLLDAGCDGDHTPADAGDVDTGADTNVDVAATGVVQGYVVLQGQVDHSAVSVLIDRTSLTDDWDSTGLWSVSHVPPGTYTVTASRAGYVSATSSPFQVRAGETTTVPPLVLAQAKGSLSGTALLADRDTHAGITVSVEGTAYVAVTAASGAWSITDVPLGNYASGQAMPATTSRSPRTSRCWPARTRRCRRSRCGGRPTPSSTSPVARTRGIRRRSAR